MAASWMPFATSRVPPRQRPTREWFSESDGGSLEGLLWGGRRGNAVRKSLGVLRRCWRFFFFFRNDVSKGTERDTDAHHSPPTAESGYLLLVTEKRKKAGGSLPPGYSQKAARRGCPLGGRGSARADLSQITGTGPWAAAQAAVAAAAVVAAVVAAAAEALATG